MLDHHPVAQPDDDLGDAVQSVHRAVDHGQLLGRKRPTGAQPLVEFGQHRLVEVAGCQRLAAETGHDRGQVGQQRRVGCARRQVEREVARTLGDATIPTRRTRTGGLAYERALAPACVDCANQGKGLPRLADRRGRHPQRSRQLAHGGQPVAGLQLAGGHQPTDGGGNALGRPIVDGRSEPASGVRRHCPVTIVTLSRSVWAHAGRRCCRWIAWCVLLDQHVCPFVAG